jgi:hypothetical protein
MRRRAKIILFTSIATIIYTGYGILQLGNQGGPCNAGLAIIALTPFLLLCTVLLATTFPWMTSSNRTSFSKPVIFSVVSLLIWTYWFYVFAEDSIKDTILYLGLFECLNVFILSFFVRQTIRNKTGNSKVSPARLSVPTGHLN